MRRFWLLATGAWQVARASICLVAKAIWSTSHLIEITIWLVLLVGQGVLIVWTGDYSNAAGWIFFYSGLALVLGIRFLVRRRASAKASSQPNST